jgi:LysM repeat protein
MKLFSTAAIFSVLLLALAAGACGGGKSSTSRIDPRKVPTATLPANLPEPLIIQGMPTRAAQTSGRTYTVESGDSLSAIADKLGTTVDELMATNNLESNELSVGQVLNVPGSSSSNEGTASPTPQKKATAQKEATATPQPETETATETPVATVAPREGQTEYVVQSGDNANDIALRFGVTVEELAAANGTTVDGLRSLQVGDVLIIPAPSTTPAATETEAPIAEEAAPTQ